MGGGAGKNCHPVKQDPADRVGVTGFEIRYLAGSDFDLFPKLREQVEIRPRKISNLKPSDTHPVGRILLHGMTVLPCTPSHFKESLQDRSWRDSLKWEGVQGRTVIP